MSVASDFLRRLTPADATLLHGVRLRALSDAPDAFGAHYADEAALDAAGQAERVRRWTDPDRAAVWIALDAKQAEHAVGVVAVVRDADKPGRAWLLSMWVDPTHRRCGTAGMLIGAVTDWAQGRGVREVCLHVTSNNAAARRLYHRHGFAETGDRMPHPRRADLCEELMRRRL